MTWHKIIDRFAMALSVLWAGYFFVIQHYETAVFMLGFFLVARGLVLVADVFYTFVADRPLIVAPMPDPAKAGLADAAPSQSKLAAVFSTLGAWLVGRNTRSTTADVEMFTDMVPAEYLPRASRG